jgi:hypothetical protein
VFHPAPNILYGVQVWALAWPLDEGDVGPVSEPLCNDLCLVTGGAILEKVRGLVDPHEKLQLFLKHPQVCISGCSSSPPS